MDRKSQQDVTTPEVLDDEFLQQPRSGRRAAILAGLTLGAYVVTVVGCAAADSPTPTLTSWA